MNLACSGARTLHADTGLGTTSSPASTSTATARATRARRMLLQFAATHNVKAVDGLDRRQQLRLRRHRPDLHRGLPALAVVVARLLQRRLDREGELHRGERRGADGEHQGRDPERAPGDAERGLRRRAYKIIVQDYSSPIPNGSGFRYSQSGYTRQSTGGCGFWNNDANWANSTAVPTINNAVKSGAAQTGLANYVVLDDQGALNGRRLCENTVGLLEEKGCRALDERRARPTRPSGSARSARRRRCSARTSSRRRAPELLGPARAAQLPAPGLQRRRAARRHVHDRDDRAHQPRRAEHEPALAQDARGGESALSSASRRSS